MMLPSKMDLVGKIATPRFVCRACLLMVVGATVSGCGVVEGSRLYHGPESVIATNSDKGRDGQDLVDGEAAIAYDPDGCQVWIIDDGLEGYASPRFDPKTGLPVCDGKYPPGTVIGNYQTSAAPIADRVPK
jgi:hypothetical protein